MSNPIDEPLLPDAIKISLELVRQRLAEYAEVMGAGKPISEETIRLQQRNLWNGVIRTILEIDPAHFDRFWAIFLDSVNQNRKGCYAPERISRGVFEMPVPPQDRRNFQRLLHLAYMTADPRGRALALKQVNMERVLSGLNSEAQRQKLIGFYRL